MDRLKGKRIVMTGAAGGIGMACAKAALMEGASLVLSGRNLQKLMQDEILKDVPMFRADMQDSGEIQALFAYAKETLGGLDGFFHCAGIESSAGFLDTDEAHFRQVISVNLTAAFLCAKEAVELMEHGGSIVFTASQKGLAGSLGSLAYNASKGGMVIMSRSMALELGKKNIRVNCLCPGPTDTPMLRRDVGSNEDENAVIDKICGSNPLHRIADAQEMVGGAMFLLSDEASFVTGTELVLDGGNIAGAQHL